VRRRHCIADGRVGFKTWVGQYKASDCLSRDRTTFRCIEYFGAFEPVVKVVRGEGAFGLFRIHFAEGEGGVVRR